MATSCPACGNEVPPKMPTCGWCGASLAGAAGATTVGVHEPDRRVFGIPPATGLLVLGVVVAAVAFYLLLTGRIVVGAIALIVGFVVLAGFPGVARRPDESAVARRALRSYDGIRGRADAAIESIAARAAARRRLAQLEGSRADAFRSLGEAVYARDEAESERLRAEITGADAALEAKRSERARIHAEAEERVGEAKLRAQPTERLEREQPEPQEQGGSE